MKQNISKIIILAIALVLIIGAIAMMVNTVSLSAPSEPDLSPVVSHYADSLTARYSEGASTAEFSRALDFNNLCLRERRIESRVYDRNIRSLVSDSASRAYAKFRRIYDNASSWSYSSLQSALHQMQILKQYKLADGSTAAMDNRCDSAHAVLQQIGRDYNEGRNLCVRGFGGDVNYENARRIINEANSFLTSHPKLNSNTEIAQAHSGMKSRLTRLHAYTISNKVDAMRGMYFSTQDELNNYVRPISASIQNYRDGVRNGVYDSYAESADNLQEKLRHNRDELMRIWTAPAPAAAE